jgi:DNA-binding response OmpR family regulator
MAKIMVVDDDEYICELVGTLLKNDGFLVSQASNGREALAMADLESPDLYIVDVMMPQMDGFELCRHLRKYYKEVPVLLLTAKSGLADKVKGFELGADDYITKPFSLKELYARAEALLRRAADDLVPLSARGSWGGGDLSIDFSSAIVKKRLSPVTLTPSEFKILSALVKYPGRVFSRNELIDTALGGGFDGYDRAIDSHIKNIRQKIEDDPKNPAYILTIRGLGYKFGGE